MISNFIFFFALSVGLAASDRFCRRPLPPTIEEVEFHFRTFLVRSEQELKILCQDTDELRDNGKLFSVPFIRKYEEICKSIHPELLQNIITINTLPKQVCEREYKEFRFSMANKLVDPSGNFVERSEHEECYEKIFANREYKKLIEGASYDYVTGSLKRSAEKMDRKGKHSISCALDRAKMSWKQWNFKTKKGVGSTAVVGGIVGMIFVLLASATTLGAFPATLLASAVFAIGVGAGQKLIQSGYGDRWRMEQYAYMNEVSRRASSLNYRESAPFS